MRYILCEDSGSGFYFWSLIKTYILKEYYQMITPSIINSMLPKNKQCDTVGISVIVSFLETITSKEYIEETKDNTYIVCIDNVSDNGDVQNNISKIFSIARTNSNIHIFDYTCFEEMILAPGNYEKFIPIHQVASDEQLRRYSIIRQHYQKNGLGKSVKLARELNKANIVFSNTERIFNKLMENISVYSKQRMGKRDYIRMRHHYIYKGKWSVCWKTDCTPNCPNDKCWEATEDNALMCTNCTSNLRGISSSCKEYADRVVQEANRSDRAKLRNYAEETTCTKNIPSKVKERIQLLFDIPEVREIDNYQ